MGMLPRRRWPGLACPGWTRNRAGSRWGRGIIFS